MRETGILQAPHSGYEFPPNCLQTTASRLIDAALCVSRESHYSPEHLLNLNVCKYEREIPGNAA